MRRKNDGIVITTNGIYTWSSVTQIFRKTFKITD